MSKKNKKYNYNVLLKNISLSTRNIIKNEVRLLNGIYEEISESYIPEENYMEFSKSNVEYVEEIQLNIFLLKKEHLNYIIYLSEKLEEQINKYLELLKIEFLKEEER